MDSKNNPPKDIRKERSEKLTEQIKENQKRKELKQFYQDMARRISIARQGRLAYERKNYQDAIKNYEHFLSITARSLNVDIKDLKPGLISEKTRVSESLLISAIAMDLAKIYDHAKTNADKLNLYLKLFVLFSAGMPFQFFVAENLRKFLQYTSKIEHRDAFKAAHKTIAKAGACFIATAIYQNDTAKEVILLRKFRDEILLKYYWGQKFILFYYKISPSIAQKIAPHLILCALLKCFMYPVLFLTDWSTKTPRSKMNMIFTFKRNKEI